MWKGKQKLNKKYSKKFREGYYGVHIKREKTREADFVKNKRGEFQRFFIIN